MMALYIWAETRRSQTLQHAATDGWHPYVGSAVKWSEVKCSDVGWNAEVRNLNGVKPNERVVKCSWVKFKWEEVKCRQV